MQLQNIQCYEGILHHKEFSMLELAFYAMALLLLDFREWSALLGFDIKNSSISMKLFFDHHNISIKSH